MLYQPGPWSLTKEGKVTDASGNCVLIQGFSSGLPGGEQPPIPYFASRPRNWLNHWNSPASYCRPARLIIFRLATQSPMPMHLLPA